MCASESYDNKNKNTDIEQKIVQRAKKMWQKLFTNLKKLLRTRKSDIVWLVYHQSKIFKKSNECQRFLICIVLKNIICLYELLTSNIKIKAILPPVFGVHWLNRIPLLLWAYCISQLSNICVLKILSNACGSQILSNAYRSLILSNTCGSQILSNACKPKFWVTLMDHFWAKKYLNAILWLLHDYIFCTPYFIYIKNLVETVVLSNNWKRG